MSTATSGTPFESKSATASAWACAGIVTAQGAEGIAESPFEIHHPTHPPSANTKSSAPSALKSPLANFAVTTVLITSGTFRGRLVAQAGVNLPVPSFRH